MLRKGIRTGYQVHVREYRARKRTLLAPYCMDRYLPFGQMKRQLLLSTESMLQLKRKQKRVFFQEFESYRLNWQMLKINSTIQVLLNIHAV
jgi:hypothetical protein